jgi:hypothetical protein
LTCAAEILNGLSGQSAGAIEQPALVYLTVYRVLRAAHDPRAAHTLETGYQQLQADAAHLADPAQRQIFWESTPARRELLLEWKQARNS